MSAYRVLPHRSQDAAGGGAGCFKGVGKVKMILMPLWADEKLGGVGTLICVSVYMCISAHGWLKLGGAVSVRYSSALERGLVCVLLREGGCRITEWSVLEEALKLIQPQPPGTGRDTFH